LKLRLYCELKDTLKYFCKHAVVEISEIEEEITLVKHILHFNTGKRSAIKSLSRLDFVGLYLAR